MACIYYHYIPLLLLLTEHKKRVIRRERHDFDSGRNAVLDHADRTNVGYVPRLDLPIC